MESRDPSIESMSLTDGEGRCLETTGEIGTFFRGDALVTGCAGCLPVAARGRVAVIADTLDVAGVVPRVESLEVTDDTLSFDGLVVVTGRLAVPAIELVVAEELIVDLRSAAGPTFDVPGRAVPAVPSVETRLAAPLIPVTFLSSGSWSAVPFVLMLEPSPALLTDDPGASRVGGFFKLLLGCTLPADAAADRDVVTVDLAVPSAAGGRRAVTAGVVGFRGAAISAFETEGVGRWRGFRADEGLTVLDATSCESATEPGPEYSDIVSKLKMHCGSGGSVFQTAAGADLLSRTREKTRFG